jgi:uncharacterized protein YndB with AHSA1/START domain
VSEELIERETLIEASLERVWSLVAKAGFWVADEASLPEAEAEAGQTTVAKNAQYGDFPVRVEKVDRPTYVAYRWVTAFPGEELRDDNSTLIEFTLASEGDSTRLRVVESGFATLPTSEEKRAKAVQDNASGWPQVLDAVKKSAEK